MDATDHVATQRIASESSACKDAHGCMRNQAAAGFLILNFAVEDIVSPIFNDRRGGSDRIID